MMTIMMQSSNIGSNENDVFIDKISSSGVYFYGSGTKEPIHNAISGNSTI